MNLEHKGKILVTGAGGFLGRNLCKLLPEDNLIKTYNTNKIENGWWCDLTDGSCVKSLMEKTEPRTVIHCAGNPSPKHPEDYKGFLENHILATVNLLENCKPGTKFIYISSVLIFGNDYPTIEPTNLYAACKLSCENIAEVYGKLNNLKINIIRPCAITGSDLTHGLLFDVKRKLKEDTPELELFGDEPGTCKPFVHIDTVCQWILKCLNEDIPLAVNCFPNDSITVKQVAEILMQELNIFKPIKWLGDGTIWKGDNRKIDTSKLNPIFVQEPSSVAVRKSV